MRLELYFTFQTQEQCDLEPKGAERIYNYQWLAKENSLCAFARQIFRGKLRRSGGSLRQCCFFIPRLWNYFSLPRGPHLTAWESISIQDKERRSCSLTVLLAVVPSQHFGLFQNVAITGEARRLPFEHQAGALSAVFSRENSNSH